MRVFGISIALFVALAAGIALAHDEKIDPTVGKAPPEGAVVLFNGKGLDGWESRRGSRPAEWTLAEDYLEVNRSGDIISKQKFTDFDLHLEFWLPLMPDARGQARANSGVYLQGRYEIQVLDSFGIDPPGGGDCGAIYNFRPPRVNACIPPEQWQTFDISFRAPRFDDAGTMTEPTNITVYHNATLIHDEVGVPEVSGSPLDREQALPGPLMLQDHSNPVRYRNIWIVPR